MATTSFFSTPSTGLAPNTVDELIDALNQKVSATDQNRVSAEQARDQAQTSASNAGLSETNVAGLASQAQSTLSQAQTASTAALTAAAGAFSSAASAASAQSSAEAARDATLIAYDNFDSRYLGSKPSNPTVDNYGEPLLAGALYFNSIAGAMRIYTGSAWVTAYVSGLDYLSSSNNLSDVANAATARTNLGAQAALVSGTSIKTINSTSLLGSGDIAVQPALVSGTSIKTINSGSLLGSGNIDVGDVTLTGTQTLTNKTLTSPVITKNIQVISTNTTAVASRTYVITASLTLTLPASPTVGDCVAFSNESGTTTAVIARNGSNIEALAEDMTINNVNYFGSLVYADATRGWIFQ